MKSCLINLLMIFCFFAGCHQQEQLKAKIFERKEIKGNRLLIRYKYWAENKWYTDSATMSNVVINSDTISVIINPANPGKSIPDITK